MSNEPEHTPGPWSVVRVAETLTIKSDVQPGYFAEIRGACRAAHGKEGEVNARLISAAPDLLAACKAALASFLDAHAHVRTGACACDAIQAAIAKAEGR